jgi:hypothetical protein
MNPSSCKASIMSGWTQSLSCGGIGISAKIPSSFKGIFQEGDEVEFIVYEDCFKIQGAGKIEWISAGGVWWGSSSINSLRKIRRPSMNF